MTKKKNNTTKKGNVKESVQATLRHIRISPQKARLMVDMIKDKPVDSALQSLDFSPKKSAELCRKLLKSAVANAQQSGKFDVDKLWVTEGWVDMGRTLMRSMPRAQGRATPIRKRSSHITLVLTER